MTATAELIASPQPVGALDRLGMNLIAGRWVQGRGETVRRVRNPADTDIVLAEVREASAQQVDEACAAAAQAFPAWRATPAPDRVRVLFRFRELLEENFLDLARDIVRENGKLLSEAKGSLRRGIDVVEFACGIPAQLMGQTLPNVSRDVDCYAVREPLGVVAGIPPFNFPAMIPLWMMPIAVACGNCFILKPAEKAPLTGARLVELFSAAGLPEGVVSVLHGGKEVSERLIANTHVQAVSFVGSSAVAGSVYRTAAEHGKRVQALGGAKNYLIVLPDGDLPRSLPALIGSCFGCAGQRCLAGSVLVAVGDRARQEAVIAGFGAGRPGPEAGRWAGRFGDPWPGPQSGAEAPHPGVDQPGAGRGRSPGAGWPIRHGSAPAAWLLCRPDPLRWGNSGNVRGPRGNLRSGGDGPAGT